MLLRRGKHFPPIIFQLSYVITTARGLIKGRYDLTGAMENKVSRKAQSRSDELEERLINFAVRIIRLSSSLPRTAAGKHIGNQIMRSGTSPAPNYGEARGAESHADFIHKCGIVLKELNETSIWLRTIERSQMLGKEMLEQLIIENQELCRIFAASLKTARARQK